MEVVLWIKNVVYYSGRDLAEEKVSTPSLSRTYVQVRNADNYNGIYALQTC